MLSSSPEVCRKEKTLGITLWITVTHVSLKINAVDT